MLPYITIGTNNFQRSVDFYDAIFKVLGYSRLPAWTESWAMWGVKASQVHAPHTDPTFMLLICAILTGISWHAFISAILLKPISS